MFRGRPVNPAIAGALEELGLPLLPRAARGARRHHRPAQPDLPEVRQPARAAAQRRPHHCRHPRELPASRRRRGVRRRPLPRPRRRARRRRRAAARPDFGDQPRERRRLARPAPGSAAGASPPDDWPNICDQPFLAPTPTPRDRRGRHSRAGFEKFPPLAALRAQFPPQAERCAILGADTLLLDRESMPPHWQLLRFGAMPVPDFLASIDFFVYFTHPLWRESYGRAIAEAIAAGKLVITDAATAEPFGPGVVTDTGTGDGIDRIIASPRRRSRAATPRRCSAPRPTSPPTGPTRSQRGCAASSNRKRPCMLFCETTGSGRSDVEDLAIFASQLAALGVPARVATGSVPENPGRNLQFDLAPHLTDGELRPDDGLVLLAADQLTDEALVRLRRLADGVEMTVRAFGRFARPRPRSGYGRGSPTSSAASPSSSTCARPIPSSRGPAPAFGVPRHSARPWQAVKDAAAAAPPRRTGPEGPDAGGGAPRARSASQLPPLRSLPTARASRTGSRRTAATSRSSTTARSCRSPWPSAPISASSSGALPAAIGCRRWSRTCSSPGRRSSTAAPATGSRTGTTPSSQRPPASSGSTSFLHAEILPNLGQIADHVRRSRAAAGAAAEPVLRLLGGAGVPLAASHRAGERRPGRGGDRLHADERRRARPRPALRADRRTRSDPGGPRRSSPRSRAAWGW